MACNPWFLLFILLLKLSSILSMRNPWSWLLCCFEMSPAFLNTSLLYGTKRRSRFILFFFCSPYKKIFHPPPPPMLPPPRLRLWHLMQSPHRGGKPSLTAKILTPRQAALPHKWIPSSPSRILTPWTRSLSLPNPTTSAPYMDTSFPCLGLLPEGIANPPTQAPIPLDKLPFLGVTLLILSRL